MQVQQAAKGVRRNEADLADVQSVIDFYQGKVMSGSGESNNNGDLDDLKPGDEVIVPSLSLIDAVKSAGEARDAVGWMKFKITKVNMLDVPGAGKAYVSCCRQMTVVADFVCSFYFTTPACQQ